MVDIITTYFYTSLECSRFFFFFFLYKIGITVTQQIWKYVNCKWHNSVQFSSVAQSCPTLCGPMNRSTYYNYSYKRLTTISCVCAQLLSHVPLFMTLWTMACQATLSMGIFRQEYWNGLAFSPRWDLPDPPNYLLMLLNHYQEKTTITTPEKQTSMESSQLQITFISSSQ